MKCPLLRSHAEHRKEKKTEVESRRKALIKASVINEIRAALINRDEESHREISPVPVGRNEGSLLSLAHRHD